MNYGVINLNRIAEDAQMICDCLGHGKYGTATYMLVETAIAETGLGQIEDKTVGAGMGITQFDEFPFDDLKKRSLDKRDKIYQNLGVDISLVEWDDLRYNPFLGLLFARLQYLPLKESIPETIEERAAYWKQYYNTPKGKGTVEHYLEMNKKFGIKID